MANDARERFALLDLDQGPRTDAARFTELTGNNLNDSKWFESADARATEYAKMSREATLARAQADVNKLPTLATVCDELAATIRGEARTTIVAPLGECRIDAEGKLTRGGAALALGEQAYKGLQSRAPDDVHTGLRGNLNAWLGRKGAATVHLRTLKRTPEQGGGRLAFAAVSDRYQPFDGDAAADLIARTLPTECRGSIRYGNDGGRWQIEAHLARPFNAPGVARRDEIHSIAIRFRGADDGTGSVVADMKAIRWICSNGIKIADVALLERVRHVGARDRFVTGIEAAIGATERAARSFGEAWGAAHGRRFTCATTGEALTADAAIKRLVARGDLHVPHARDLEERILAAWEFERGDTAGDVLNAITRCAHNSGWKSQWYQDDLEDQAGTLLYQPTRWALPEAEAA